MTSPIVTITTVHVPLAVFTSVGLFVVGIVFLIYSVRRHRRTHDSSWVVLSVAAALISALSTASLIIDFLRHP